jgi:pimeloyl-ACP methyl ester carboxylesterase
VPVARSSAGDIEYLITGSGAPATVFVPGLAMSIPDTRPFGSGVAGTKAFLHLRGHGGSTAPDVDDLPAWTYDALADDVAAVADDVAARQALGVSLGAGALLALAVREPQRFTRLVFALPAALDASTEELVTQERAESNAQAHRLADALDARDAVAVGQLLLQLQPAEVRARPDVRLWARRHADVLLSSPVARALRRLPRELPLTDATSLASLASLSIPVLVLAQRDDPRHPLVVAQRLAAALPRAQLEACDGSWLWTSREALRATVSAFLNAG